MAVVALFHSVLGLRRVEHRGAERLQAAGHEVLTPDLFNGATTDDIDEGFARLERIGWSTIEDRARAAVRLLPADAVLIGFSMGAGVIDALLPDRPDTAGILLLHGLAQLPGSARPALPVQLHMADPDPFAGASEVADWRISALDAGADVAVHTYPGVGHFYIDEDLPDYDEQAATVTWERVLRFLQGL